MAVKLSAARAGRQAGRRPEVARRIVSLLARCGFVMAALVSIGCGRSAAAATGFSDWSKNLHAAARLIALGPPTAGTERQAGLEIRLDPGYLTYWRQPGDAGLPPTLDTSGSLNVGHVEVDYPAPHVFDEAGATLFGYQGSVVLPLRITVADPGRPAVLAVVLDYAVCGTICLPGRADLSLPLPDETLPEAAALIDAARDAVPRPALLGAPGLRAIDSVVADNTVPAPTLQVMARGRAPANLFVEGPEGWFFVAGAPIQPSPGTLVFPVAITDRPHDGATGPLDLRLTLVDAMGAIEVPVHMDAVASKP